MGLLNTEDQQKECRVEFVFWGILLAILIVISFIFPFEKFYIVGLFCLAMVNLWKACKIIIEKLDEIKDNMRG